MKLDANAIAQIRDHVEEIDPNDDDLLGDMLEGETDAADVLDALIADKQDADAMAAAIKAHIQELARRRSRMEARAASCKVAMQQLLELCHMRKWQRPLATVSLTARKPRRIVTDETAVPDDFAKWERKIDRTALQNADGDVPGTTLDNGGTSVVVRTK